MLPGKKTPPLNSSSSGTTNILCCPSTLMPTDDDANDDVIAFNIIFCLKLRFGLLSKFDFSKRDIKLNELINMTSFSFVMTAFSQSRTSSSWHETNTHSRAKNDIPLKNLIIQKLI